jgi:murein DD-endopeptidase MepM/ murein hydrolase activator NlpD
MSPKRALVVMIHREGVLESRSFRIPVWRLRASIILVSLVAVLVVLGAVLYAPIVRTAASVPGMSRELERLRSENAQVRELARTLSLAESRYAQVRDMLGGDFVPALPGEGLERIPVTAAVFAQAPGSLRRYEDGMSIPSHWPLDQRGVVTRGQVSPGARDESHPGMDIAIARGTPIRASGGGLVGEVGEDAEYGIFVLLDHPQGYQTIYGHASRVLVQLGDSVASGQVIALSGSTGRSTGPHLHFEIRRNSQSLDPRSLVREEL